MIGVWALIWLGCTPEQPAPAPALASSPVATPAPVAAPAATPAVQIWTVDNIKTLMPVVPSRKGTVPTVLPLDPAYDEILQKLYSIVETYAGDAENPWAVAHGLLARNKDFKLNDGRIAIPQIIASYAEERMVGPLHLWGFPRKRDTIRIEPHTDLLLKNMQEAGVPPDATFPHGSEQYAVADLYRYTLLKTALDAKSNHSSFDSPNDIPWGLQALATWAPDAELQWIAADGTAMDLDYLTDFTVAVLTKESAFMFEAFQKGQRFDRSGQGLFGYTCGGAHLLQGASYAVARGFGGANSRKAIEAQVPLMFYRMPIELDIYTKARNSNPKYKDRLWSQQLKFLGHFLETMSKLSAMGFYSPDAAQQKLLETAAQNLVIAVRALSDAGTLDNMPKLHTQDEQLYLDIVGDSAHAIRGLELALGRGNILY